MGSTMSEELRKSLEEIAASAEPYDDAAPEMNTFDGGGDFQRMLATLAQKALRGEI